MHGYCFGSAYGLQGAQGGRRGRLSEHEIPAKLRLDRPAVPEGREISLNETAEVLRNERVLIFEGFLETPILAGQSGDGLGGAGEIIRDPGKLVGHLENFLDPVAHFRIDVREAAQVDAHTGRKAMLQGPCVRILEHLVAQSALKAVYAFDAECFFETGPNP